MKRELLTYLTVQANVPPTVASELLDGADEFLELLADALHASAECNRARMLLAYVEAGTRLVHAELGERLGPDLIAVAQRMYDDAKKAAEADGGESEAREVTGQADSA